MLLETQRFERRVSYPEKPFLVMSMLRFFRPRDLNAVCHIVMSMDCYLRTKDLKAAMCNILRKPTLL
jgi:hypothetical protein